MPIFCPGPPLTWTTSLCPSDHSLKFSSPKKPPLTNPSPQPGWVLLLLFSAVFLYSTYHLCYKFRLSDLHYMNVPALKGQHHLCFGHQCYHSTGPGSWWVLSKYVLHECYKRQTVSRFQPPYFITRKAIEQSILYVLLCAVMVAPKERNRQALRRNKHTDREPQGPWQLQPNLSYPSCLLSGNLAPGN